VESGGDVYSVAVEQPRLEEVYLRLLADEGQ
jgi:hypothetical protein